MERVRGRELRPRKVLPRGPVASLYQAVPFRQETSVLMVGERTNTNGSKAFREALLAGSWNDVVRWPGTRPARART